MKSNGTGYLKDSSNGLPMLLFLNSSLIKIFSVSDLVFCYFVYLYFIMYVERHDVFRENSNTCSIISVSWTASVASVHSAVSPGFHATTNVPSCVMLERVQNPLTLSRSHQLKTELNWNKVHPAYKGKTPLIFFENPSL